MRPEAWSQVDELFQAALEIVPADRAAFLHEACGGNDTLQREIESLLISDSHEWDLLDASALESAAILLADEEPQLTSGQRVAHYEIKDLLGQGGMGEVYLAQDQILNRMIALKLLPAGYAQDRERLARFEREARTISALNHPNILTVYEFGSFDDKHFIATEFVDGETLRERLALGPLSLPEVVDIGCQLAGAAAAAHGAGVVHRDIKPENIMLRPDGYVKILDFGLAKLLEEPVVDRTLATGQENDTSSRLLMGTPRYMSPEQVRGLPIGPTTDIFSLGGVLYEMLAARPAFAAKTHDELTRSILNDEPPTLSNTLSAVIAKMLSKDKGDRYQSAEDVLEALKSVRDRSGTHDGHQPLHLAEQRHAPLASWRGRVTATLALIAILFGGGYLASRLSSGKRSVSTSSLVDHAGWLSKVPLSAPRSSAGLAVLDNDLYAIGGSNGCNAFSDVVVYDPEHDTWLKHAHLSGPRGGHGVAVLEGQIYAVGGMTNCDDTTDTVETYVAKSDQWLIRAPLPLACSFNAVVAVDGDLFSIGGRSSSGTPLTLNTRYDPRSDTWTEMAEMPTPRMGAGAAVLGGLIYVIGGTDGSRPISTVEVYDPRSNLWTTRRSMLHPRDWPSVAELDGVVYSIGGSADRSSVEAYDPTVDAWTEIAGLPARRYLAPAIAFKGSIYLAGGFDGANYLASVLALTMHAAPEASEQKCPSLRIVSKSQMPVARHGMTVGAIGGVAYVIGGYRKGPSFTDSFLSTNESYDPLTDVWVEKAPMPSSRETSGSNSAVVGQKLYVIGGTERGQCTNLNQVYDPATDKWTTKAAMPTSRCHLAVIAHNDLIYAIGGVNTSSTIRYATVEVYNPASDSWSSAPPMPTPRYYPGAVSLNGLIYVVGGFDPTTNPGELTVVEAFDPATGEWAKKAPMTEGRRAMSAAVVNGLLVVFGGVNSDRFVSTAEVYDPVRDNWSRFETSGTPRANSAAVTIDDTLYIFGGYSSDAPASLATNEAFNLSQCRE